MWTRRRKHFTKRPFRFTAVYGYLQLRVAPLYAAAFAIFWIVLPGFKDNQTALFIQILIGVGVAGGM